MHVNLLSRKLKERTEQYLPKVLRKNDNLDIIEDIKPNQKLAVLKLKGNRLHSQCKSGSVECPLTLTASGLFH